MEMLKIHVQHNALDNDQAKIMGGAMDFKDKSVTDVMTKIDAVKMLSVDDQLDFSTIETIFRWGFSRIPVYRNDKNNIVGILFTKDLIFCDPEDATPVSNFLQIFGRSFTKVGCPQ